MNRSILSRGALVTAALLAAGVAWGVPCTIDPAPAATLLFPFFSLDLGECANPSERTVITVLNTRLDPVLAHFTIWTNAAVPVAGFDLYLQGYDIQSILVNDIVCEGLLPSTGPATSPVGEDSGPPVSFPSCGDPVASPLLPAEVESLQAYLSGEMSQLSGKCAGWPTGRAEGYITVDVTNECTTSDPSSPAYYGGILANDNVLAGEYQVGDLDNNFAQGFEAVHIEAYPAAFAPGDVTFYGRYNAASAADAREPLGTAYRVPYEISGPASGVTQAVVWRETGSDALPWTCGGVPSWWPLPISSVVAFPDIDTAGLGGLPVHARVDLATQRLDLDGPWLRIHPATAQRGWLFFNLQHDFSPYSPPLRVGQGWVSVIRSTEGRYSTGEHATQLDSACAPATIPFVSPGRADYNDTPVPQP